MWYYKQICIIITGNVCLIYGSLNKRNIYRKCILLSVLHTSFMPRVSRIFFNSLFLWTLFSLKKITFVTMQWTENNQRCKLENWIFYFGLFDILFRQLLFIHSMIAAFTFIEIIVHACLSTIIAAKRHLQKRKINVMIFFFHGTYNTHYQKTYKWIEIIECWYFQKIQNIFVIDIPNAQMLL